MIQSPEPSTFKSPAPPSLHQPSDIRLYHLLTSYNWEKPALKTLFDRHGVAPWEGQAVLVKEITRDGSNTIMSLLMGNSEKSYIDLVKAVANKLKVPVHPEDNEIEIERKCLETVLRKYLRSASDDERNQIMEIIREQEKEFHSQEVAQKIRDNTLRLGTLSLLVKEIGARATGQVVRKIVARILSQTAAREVSKRAAQLAGLAIPLLNAVMIGWTVWDLAGPAYRKTIPTVLEIAMLRLEAGDNHCTTVESN